jgi:hypothetical protein
LTCRYYGISRQIFSTWRRRGDAHGLDGLRDRSHRPLVSPNATRTEVVGKILYCASYHVGPVKIAMYLKRYHDIQISPSGVWRILKGLDLNRLPGLACLLRRIGHLADPTGTPDLVGARADADSAASDGLEAGLMAATGRTAPAPGCAFTCSLTATTPTASSRCWSNWRVLPRAPGGPAVARLSSHWSHKMRAHLDTHCDWLTVERLPAYAPELNPVEYLWANLKGGELANCGGDTIAEVADQAEYGIQRVCDSDSLVVGFLAHTGLSLDDQPSP